MNSRSLLLLVIVTLLHAACVQASSLETSVVDAQEKETDTQQERKDLEKRVAEREAKIRNLIKKQSGLVTVFH